MLSGRRGQLLATGIGASMLADRLTSVRYRNFMSFADEEVELGDLVVLVGLNGSGKSNFIEGLRFLRDALTIGLDAAITNRGGIGQIRRKLPHTGRRRDVKIGIEAVVDGSRFSYEVAISASARGDWRLGSETCRIESGTGEVGGFRQEGEGFFFTGLDDHGGLLDKTEITLGASRLMLPLVGEPFSALTRFLTGIGAYRIYPNALREPQRLLRPARLDDDAGNLASVLRRLRRERPSPAADCIRDALSEIVPDATDFRVTEPGGFLAVALAFQRDGRNVTVRCVPALGWDVANARHPHRDSPAARSAADRDRGAGADRSPRCRRRARRRTRRCRSPDADAGNYALARPRCADAPRFAAGRRDDRRGDEGGS